MKIVFLIMVLLHGLIHLLGFLKGFDLKEVKELTLPISKSIGLIWLTAAAFFMIYTILHLTNSKYAWLIGFIAVLISQILVVMFWNDAKFGTIPNLIIFVVSFVGLGSFLLKNEFEKQVKADFYSNNALSTEILSESDLEHLPELVKKYLHYTQSVGQPKIKNFRAEFVGGMRAKPDEAYMNLRSVQYNFYQNPSRYFYMKASKMALPSTGLHLYQNQAATFEVKLLNWFKVVDAEGEMMNQAETVTLLNDMCFIAPATLIDDRISWKVIDETSVQATFKNGGISISAFLYFNEEGELINFISNDRYDTNGKQYLSYPWKTPVQDYRMINGYLLPSKAQLIYQRPDGFYLWRVRI